MSEAPLVAALHAVRAGRARASDVERIERVLVPVLLARPRSDLMQLALERVIRRAASMRAATDAEAFAWLASVGRSAQLDEARREVRRLDVAVGDMGELAAVEAADLPPVPRGGSITESVARALEREAERLAEPLRWSRRRRLTKYARAALGRRVLGLDHHGLSRRLLVRVPRARLDKWVHRGLPLARDAARSWCAREGPPTALAELLARALAPRAHCFDGGRT